MLSLTYCGIDHTAAQALFEILIYTRSALEEVNLSGNSLGNEGTCRVLMGTAVAKSLKKIYLADNQFQDDDDFLKAVCFCMETNKKLNKYDFKYNNITDRGKWCNGLNGRCRFDYDHREFEGRRAARDLGGDPAAHRGQAGVRRLQGPAGRECEGGEEGQEGRQEKEEEGVKVLIEVRCLYTPL